MRKIRKNEIYMCDFKDSSHISGTYPVLVISGVYGPSTLVAPIVPYSPALFKRNYVYIGTGSGVKRESMALLDNLINVNTCDLYSYVGEVTYERSIERINTVLKRSFLISDGDIRFLCKECFSEYTRDKKVVANRLHPSEKGLCSKCKSKVGYEYVIKRKNIYYSV